jgi:hypothetical protein
MLCVYCCRISFISFAEFLICFWSVSNTFAACFSLSFSRGVACIVRVYFYFYFFLVFVRSFVRSFLFVRSFPSVSLLALGINIYI